MNGWEKVGGSGVEDAVYEGHAGATSTESVHIRGGGTYRCVSIHRTVNVATDPHLRALALSGRLHVLEDGSALACTFVYHDPAARKLALVVPEVLRHRELKARARFLRQLASDSVAVPQYVAEARVVIGTGELAKYLASEAEPDVDARERALEVRERRIRERAEEITRHEDELARMREELEVERARVQVEPSQDDEFEEVEELGDVAGTSPLIRAEPLGIEVQQGIEAHGAELIQDDDLEEDVDELELEPDPEPVSDSSLLEVREDAASDLHDAAHRAILAFQHGAQDVLEPDGDLTGKSAEELVSILERSNSSTQVDAVCHALRDRSADEILRVLPRVAKLGDEAGDALIEGLTASSEVARHAFALALAHLGLRRAVIPLVHLLSTEPTERWREIARICGRFGNASVRALLQKAKDGQVPDERCALALAHLSNQGCEAQVQALIGDSDVVIAELVKRVEGLRDEARRQDALVSGTEALPDPDEPLEFARRLGHALEDAQETGLFSASPGRDT